MVTSKSQNDSKMEKSMFKKAMNFISKLKGFILTPTQTFIHNSEHHLFDQRFDRKVDTQ